MFCLDPSTHKKGHVVLHRCQWSIWERFRVWVYVCVDLSVVSKMRWLLFFSFVSASFINTVSRSRRHCAVSSGRRWWDYKTPSLVCCSMLLLWLWLYSPVSLTSLSSSFFRSRHIAHTYPAYWREYRPLVWSARYSRPVQQFYSRRYSQLEWVLLCWQVCEERSVSGWVSEWGIWCMYKVNVRRGMPTHSLGVF